MIILNPKFKHRRAWLGLMFLVCFVFQCLPAWAQPRLRAPEYYVGFHGGISASTVIFSPSVGQMKPITDACILGGNGGFVFRYAGHKYCAFQMELNYAGHGWAEGTAATGKYYRRLHYLELPILFHLNFGTEVGRWFFNVGPLVGICVKDDGNYGTLVNGETATQYEKIHKPFKWGATAGTGFYINTTKAGLYQFEVRFNYSVNGIFGTGASDHFNMASPMDLSINLGWLIPIRPKKKVKIES